ncbi:hypothetical protein HKK52_05990 [Pseudomonas sp. ADAK2]|uniref:hypothetical protein n=1 Tax=unclassified Pseudomonas TaxID=196821 RepID=UPI0014642E6F|nr:MULTISPECIES: hypothetical protein [unclassified Pseudomonas]QJI40485.1 hypothetical protein HKK53_05985 [Pseudomonas sp. ADAK7]QJI46790.1 hypothetical protein HKK52_05990 [Pseudomonas sp. ADAK2]
MEFLKPLSIFSLGIYSAIGVAALIVLYFLFYGARCFDSWMKKQPMPTDRVWAFVVVAALLGLCIGSFTQGITEIHAECAAYGQPVGPCFFKHISP